MRPRVHHLEGSDPVYRGDDCARLGLAELAGVLASGGLVDWVGFFRAGRSVQFAAAAHKAAFGQEVRGTELWAGLERAYAEACR